MATRTNNPILFASHAWVSSAQQGPLYARFGRQKYEGNRRRFLETAPDQETYNLVNQNFTGTTIESRAAILASKVKYHGMT